MAEIIYIALGKEPPRGPWVLVERAPLSSFVNEHAIVEHSDGTTFYVTAAKDWDAVTADAVAWADTHKISAVYVRGRRT
jgi:hypothetical protein